MPFKVTMFKTAYLQNMASLRQLKCRRDTISLSEVRSSSPSPQVQHSSPDIRPRPFHSHHSLLRKRIKLNPLLIKAQFENSKHSTHSSGAPISQISESADAPEDDASNQELEVDDSLDQVIMAVDMRDKGTVGCCYYVAKEEKLYLMDDVKYCGIEVIDAR